MGTVSVLILEHVFHLFDTVVAHPAEAPPLAVMTWVGVVHLFAAIAGGGFLVFHALILPDDGLAHKLYSRKLGST